MSIFKPCETRLQGVKKTGLTKYHCGVVISIDPGLLQLLLVRHYKITYHLFRDFSVV